MNLQAALSINDRGVVSLVGGGGKTSLMFCLARELVSCGRRVLTTTTTKIFMPTPAESAVTIVSKDAREILEKAEYCMGRTLHVTVGTEILPAHGKLKGLDTRLLEAMVQSNFFDLIIVEADGAAGRPLKACAPHEPVVPHFSDRVISVVGLDVVEKPMEEAWVFRSDRFSRITGLSPMQPVTPSAIASMLIHDMSAVAVTGKAVKKIAFLNKADDEKALKEAERIGYILKKKGRGIFDRVVIGALRERPVIRSCRDIMI